MRKHILNHIWDLSAGCRVFRRFADLSPSFSTMCTIFFGNVALQQNVLIRLPSVFLALFVLQIAIVCGISQVVANEGVAQKRSNFEYVDEKLDGSKRYRRPNLDVDPMELSVEELRARIVILEERLEALENAGKHKRGAAR